MERGVEKHIRMVALFPHEDVAAIVHEYRIRLFSSGILGALSLPICVPLGAADHALKFDNLKEIARAVRTARADMLFEFAAPMRINDAATFAAEITDINGTNILAAPLHPNVEIRKSHGLQPYKNTSLLIAFAGPNTTTLKAEPPFPIRFRAAYVANLIIRPLAVGAQGLSFEWEQGRPAWLPK